MEVLWWNWIFWHSVSNNANSVLLLTHIDFAMLLREPGQDCIALLEEFLAAQVSGPLME